MLFSQIQDQLRRDAGYQGAVVSTDILATIKTAINWAYQLLAAEENFYWWLKELSIPLVAGDERLSLLPDFLDFLDVRNSNDEPVHPRTLSAQLKYYERLGWLGKQTYSIGTVDQFDYYSTGTVSIANGSDQVTLGGGGTFTSDMVNRVLEIDNDVNEPYIITAYTNGTTVTVDHTRRGSSIVDSNFVIDKAGTRRLKFEPAVLATDTWTFYYYFSPPELVQGSDEPMMPREFHRYLVAAPRVTLLHGIEERKTLYDQAKIEKAEILSKMKKRNNVGTANMKLQIGSYAY